MYDPIHSSMTLPSTPGTSTGTEIRTPPSTVDTITDIRNISQPPNYPHFMNVTEWVLIFGMLIILIAPAVGKFLEWPPEQDLQENRHLAQHPNFKNTSLQELPQAVDRWWNDRFAFRTQLIPLRELIWLDIFRAPGKFYVRGLDGHLFLNPLPGEKFHDGQNSTVLDYLGCNRLTADHLSLWTDYIEGKNAWLLAHGIHYLFVIAPNKISIEDRFLPDRIRAARGESYLEQLRKKVFPKLTSQVDLLDLTAVMMSLEQETGKPMFSRTGDVSHWNCDGFKYGLMVMDNHLRHYFPDMPAFPEDKLQLQQSENDLTRITCKWDSDPDVHPVEETIIAFRSDGWDDPKCSWTAGRKGHLVLFSDSSWKGFCAGLSAFFPGTHTAFPYQWGQHRHADIYHTTFEELRQIVKKEQPDVVVEAQTERAMMIPPNIGVPAEFRLAARFARGRVLFSLAENRHNSLSGFNIDEISDDGDAIIVRSTSEVPSLNILKPMMISKDSETVLFIDMDAPIAGILQIFWTEHGEFNETDSFKAPIEAGQNILFLPVMMRTERAQYLRIDPGSSAGTYRIRKIEIRTNP
jgi:hypothetical protein